MNTHLRDEEQQLCPAPVLMVEPQELLRAAGCPSALPGLRYSRVSLCRIKHTLREGMEMDRHSMCCTGWRLLEATSAECGWSHPRESRSRAQPSAGRAQTAAELGLVRNAREKGCAREARAAGTQLTPQETSSRPSLGEALSSQREGGKGGRKGAGRQRPPSPRPLPGRTGGKWRRREGR